MFARMEESANQYTSNVKYAQVLYQNKSIVHLYINMFQKPANIFYRIPLY